jgi:hypothetical protein
MSPKAFRPANAFSTLFLRRLAERDEPATAREAETAGPWKVVEVPGRGFGVLRQEKTLERGDPWTARFDERAPALLTAALLPATGLEPVYRLDLEAGPAGYALREAGEVRGHCQLYDAHLALLLNAADVLARSPRSLALFLEAVGGLALERTGRILAEQLAPPPRDEP